MSSGWQLVIGSITGAPVVYGLVALVKALLLKKRTDAQAKVTEADAAGRLAGNAMEMIERVRKDSEEQIRLAREGAAAEMARVRNDATTSVQQALADVTSARRDTDEARRDASEARREATAARKEAEATNVLLRKLLTEIFRADASVDRMRAIVNDFGGSASPAVVNGRF